MNTLAVIGSASLARLPQWHTGARRIVRTPYGQPSAPLLEGEVGGRPVVFLCRHGLNNTIAPQLINYRANIWALHSIGVRRIVSVSAVRPLHDGFSAGELLLPHDLIDYTHSREDSFVERGTLENAYTDFTHPYDHALRNELLALIRQSGMPAHEAVVYACVQGARLPTAAEARRMRQDGADVYGMTAMPEAILARELGMAYAHLCGVLAPERDGSHPALDAVRQLIDRL